MAESRRGWGPFSGGQLTMMVCVIVAAVAFPMGAWAVVSGSKVFVTDPTSGARAAVSASGALDVSGSVTANNASAKNLYQYWSALGNGTAHPQGVPPAGKALVVTEVVIETYSNPSPGPSSSVGILTSNTDATCAHASRLDFDVTPPGLGLTTVPFPSGLVIPANRALCVLVGGLGVEAGVFGYLIPASSAPPGA